MPVDFARHKRLVEAVNLPEKVKCKRCKKIRALSSYSKRQLEELRKEVAYGRTNGVTGPGVACCTDCTSHQVYELTCAMCDKTMDLSCFSLNQRREGDDARCKRCVQSHLDTDPISDENKRMIENESCLEPSTYQSQTGDTGIDTMRTLSIADKPNVNVADNQSTGGEPYLRTRAIKSDNDDDDDDEEDDDGQPRPGIWLPGQKKDNAGISYAAYDADGTAHARTAVPPSETGGSSVHSGWASWGIVPSINREDISPANQRGFGRRNPGFAKVPGQRVPKEDAPKQDFKDPIGQSIESDDEDSDNDPSNWL